ncbi:MAG: PEP-CTERM sorting domain-containing protein [Phycisphaerae bacterium]|nr:PEP-CTERM sorting domain-containing protein [Phycisphaerae bacterium]
MKHRISLMCVFSLVLSVSAQAGYILEPSSSGASLATVAWGDSFTLDFVLASDAGDVHDSAIFQVLFTEPGLMYESYDWSDPYTDGPPYDDSTPDLSGLPLAIDEDTLAGPAYPSGVVDVELSNVLIGSTFAEGTLVSLDLTVPDDYGFVGSVYIFALPDTFAHGFDEIPITGGQGFELIVIPEPSTLAVMGMVMFGLLRRRR